MTAQLVQKTRRVVDADTREGGARGAMVDGAVFTTDIGRVGECRRIIWDVYKSEMAATSYIPQSPCEGSFWQLSVLASTGIEAMSKSRELLSPIIPQVNHSQSSCPPE
jgi:hypothetical protein